MGATVQEVLTSHGYTKEKLEDVMANFNYDIAWKTWCRRHGVRRGIRASAQGSQICKDGAVYIVKGFSGDLSEPIQAENVLTEELRNFKATELHKEHYFGRTF